MEAPSNRLAGETSPYLQQHARNPVDWYPWGEEALARARSEDRPIFLSVGYSACHWCHVMERESFEDEEIARFMNDHFVNVKVDREERPDIDATYMSAVQMLTGSGGWPMSVFLTPELKPFWGGTYFPPRARWGRPGFLDVLREIARVCGEDRARVEQTARDLTDRLSHMERLPAADAPGGTALIDAFVEQSIRSFDARWGGFGSAPKFPRSVDLSLLLCVHRRTGSAEILEICEKTLDGMALGGMYDQIGGGFHRYSTDARWLVPHFEKMLYDNALLARTYVEAWQVSGKPLYRRIACEVLDYVLREMTSPEGGFYSATDADSEGEEGKFFVWTPAEVEVVAGAEGARRICAYYDITERGNFENETSIPHCPRALDEVARSLAVDRDELERSLAGLRLELREAREAREKPFRDEKVITAWNALMVSAFAVAYQVFRDERYLEAARRAERFLRERLLVGEQLQRTYKDGRARHDAFLDDHAYLIAALIDLYEATFETGYLITARDLAAHVVRHFHDADNGGFFFSSTYHEELTGRRKELMDGATPSSNGVAALSFARLERLLGSGTYQLHAEGALRAAGRLMEQVPAGFAASLLALDHLLHPPVEIAVVGSPDEAMLRAIHEPFVPARVVAGRILSAGADGAATIDVPFLADKAEPATGVAVWVCKDLACSPPSSDPAEVRRLLA